MPSENSRSRSTTPVTELLELTQQFTPHKSPSTVRRIIADIQSLANDVGDSQSAVKRKLADVTNQLGTTRQPRKRRHRGNRAADAPEDVENPATIEERVRKAGRHFVLEYGLFITDIQGVLATEEDPTFREDTEFETEKSRIQGQLRDIIALLPADARAFREQDWIGSAFEDGMKGMRSSIHTRLRSESLTLIVANINKFIDGQSATNADFETSASRLTAFSKLTGYQPATADAAAFYSLFKAELIWFLSGDTQLSYAGEGDETGIDYKFWFETFLRQICDGLRDEAEWALGLMRYWDDVLFPHAEDSLGESTSTNQQAIRADINAMDEAFRAAPRREELAAPQPPREPSPQPLREPSPTPPSPPRQSLPPRASTSGKSSRCRRR
ncbi:hypothetical protein C8R44DRAFT_983722 [Mycena epipterygia]|nr:hypothetical protein C8R44DRAFT_983722 [Mycena epipterygia]